MKITKLTVVQNGFADKASVEASITVQNDEGNLYLFPFAENDIPALLSAHLSHNCQVEHSPYRSVKTYSFIYNEQPVSTTPMLDAIRQILKSLNEKVSRGSRGEKVKELQRTLNLTRFGRMKISEDGIFGPDTEAALKKETGYTICHDLTSLKLKMLNKQRELIALSHKHGFKLD